MTESTTICSKCGTAYNAPVYQSINAADSPELKSRVISGELFLHVCPECGNVDLVKYPMLYHDPQEKLLLCLSDRDMSVDGLDGYTARRVTTVGDLIEKIKIFDAGLDDIAVEMCKYVTARETGRDVPMKFLKADGADQDLIFTYPQDGRMEMLSVGFNVYQDCVSILQRNPLVTESVKGLATVDAAWLRLHIA